MQRYVSVTISFLAYSKYNCRICTMTKVTSMLSTTTTTTTARPTAYSNGNERIVYRKKQKERSRTINLTPRN